MTGLPLLDDAGLMDALRSEVAEGRSAHARVVSLVGEMQRRGLDARAGYASLAELLKHAVRMDTREAKSVLGTQGEVLELGQMTRKIPTRLRNALRQRDGGRAFPGCTRPATWCDAHHVIEWKDGGPTDLDNLVLLCEAHHRVVHHTDWEIRMIKRIPWFIPPALIRPGAKTPAQPAQNPGRRMTGDPPRQAGPRPGPMEPVRSYRWEWLSSVRRSS